MSLYSSNVLCSQAESSGCNSQGAGSTLSRGRRDRIVRSRLHVRRVDARPVSKTAAMRRDRRCARMEDFCEARRPRSGIGDDRPDGRSGVRRGSPPPEATIPSAHMLLSRAGFRPSIAKSTACNEERGERETGRPLKPRTVPNYDLLLCLIGSGRDRSDMLTNSRHRSTRLLFSVYSICFCFFLFGGFFFWGHFFWDTFGPLWWALILSLM